MKQALQIIPSLHPLRDTAAWLLPGGEVERWLRVIAQGGWPFESVRMRVLPTSADDLTPAGVLLTGCDNAARPAPDAQPYGLIGGRLYLPTHARLDPQVTDAEIAEMLATPTAVFHPTLGLIGFTEADVVRPLSLLQAPAAAESSWSMPESEALVSPCLRSIEPLEPLSIESLDQDLGEGIGDKPFIELPPLPDERDPGTLGKAGRRGMDGIAGVVGWFTSKVPGGAAKPTWVDALEQWANHHRIRPGQIDQEKRNRELNRLIEMLKRSPAEGLSHAIPLSGLMQARGMAAAGNQLTRRGTNFSLSGLFGSGPADPWDIASQQHDALVKTYRKLAVEEAQQGRYRRAAYIYGSLLGDVEASARVLEEGGYFEEAAIILRDKLQQPLAAARCLERGGRLGEAIDLFLAHHDWLAAAAIYERLEQTESARRWYRHAAEDKTQVGDFVGAAALLEDKLHDAPEAERVLLLGALPPARNASCLKSLIELSGRHGRHHQVQRTINQLLDDTHRSAEAGPLAQSLSEAQGSYPDALVRARMAEAVMTLVGRHLPAERSLASATPFTNAIRALAPQDTLLARDTARHLQRLKNTPPKPQAVIPHARSENRITQLVKTLTVGQGVWHRVFRIEGPLFVLGDVRHPSPHLVVARVQNKDDQTMVTYSHIVRSTWNDPDGFASSVVAGVVPHATPNRHQILVAVLGQPRIKNQLCSMAQAPPYVAAGLPDPWPAQTLAVSNDVPNVTWVLAGTLADQIELVLNAYQAQRLTQSISVTLEPEVWQAINECPSSPRIRLHARREVVVLTVGPVLMHFSGGAMISVEILDEPVTEMVGVVPFGRTRYALLQEHGLTMVWGFSKSRKLETFCRDTLKPVGAFTHSAGLLVVADEAGASLYSTSKGQINRVERFAWQDVASRPVDVYPIGHGDDFGVLFEDGTIQRYAVTAPYGGRR